MTPVERAEILGYTNAGWSVRAIAKATGIPKSTVGNTIKRMERRVGCKSQSRSGCPHAISHDGEKQIDAYLRKHGDAVPKEIKEALQLQASARTIARVRTRLGYKGRKGMRSIVLTEAQKRERVAWCQRLRGDDLGDMIFTDEKPFELYKRRRLVYVRPGQRVRMRPTVKYPPKLQVWGGISRKGKTQLMFWRGRGKAGDYIDTLKRAALPFIRNVHPDHHRFLHDKDTTHTAHQTQTWLTEKKVNVLVCPTNSPDLNAIEFVWNTLEARVLAHNPSTVAALRRWIVIEWNKLTVQFLNDTIDHVVSLIPMVIEKGGEFMGVRRPH